MKNAFTWAMIIIIPLLCAVSPGFAEERLLLMAGAAAQPVVEDLAKGFEAKTGIKVDTNIGGSGNLLSQMKLAKKGDVYFPGSVDFIEKAREEDQILASTVTPIVYLVPAINVQPGNPKQITGLKDLCRPGIRVIIANPETVCLGVFAVELVEKFFSPEEKKAFRGNIVNYAESCEKTASSIALKAADAVIGWSVFQYWNPKLIETVPLKPEEIVRLSYLAVAVTRYARNPESAQKFIEYMKSPEGLGLFKKYRYFVTAEEALAFVGKPKPVGGDCYQVPPDWMK
ncbi:MAG: molybdate ABC transporter substrate-binding protein [Candidatus Ozemobacteraceae bacterium]